MKIAKLYQALLLILLLGTVVDGYAENVNIPPAFQTPAVLDLTIEQKRNLRVTLLEQLLVKYESQNVFEQMRTYINSKLTTLEDGEPIEPPQVLIRETLERTRAVYEKVQPLVGNQFKRNYNPQDIEAKINKFSWLKKPAFLILGIREKHKIALSFFYLAENEALKRKFLRDAVQYSYPEILDTPENEAWFEAMNSVMDRLGYKFFNVDKYINQKTEE